MATPIIMPKFGQMTEESAIVEWLKKEGDKVAKGDILFTVETDKSVMEVESFEAGTLLKIVVKPGVSVPVQSTVGFLGQPGDAIPEVTAPPPPRLRSPRRQGALSPARRPHRSLAPLPSHSSPLPPHHSSPPSLHHSSPPCSASAPAPRPWRATASSTRRASRAPGPADASSRRT